ncbi:toprim domain-containing protein [Lachnospiraceae bacterium ZAX-1]
MKRIRLYLDNDVPGRKAAKELIQKYEKLFYEVKDDPPPKPYKDYNEWTVAGKGIPYRSSTRANWNSDRIQTMCSRNSAGTYTRAKEGTLKNKLGKSRVN